MEQKYLVGQERLIELLDREAKLFALEAGGVDNWDWYDQSLEDNYEEITEVDEEEFPKA